MAFDALVGEQARHARIADDCDACHFCEGWLFHDGGDDDLRYRASAAWVQDRVASRLSPALAPSCRMAIWPQADARGTAGAFICDRIETGQNPSGWVGLEKCTLALSFGPWILFLPHEGTGLDQPRFAF